jgi:pilus assembly protein Flp/PilA
MTTMLNRFLKDKTGATAVEYALIVALLAAVIVGAVTTLGGGISTAFTNIKTKLTTTTGSL